MKERPIENPSKLGAVDIIERLLALMAPRTEAITRSNFILMVVWMMVGGIIEMAISPPLSFLRFFMSERTRD